MTTDTASHFIAPQAQIQWAKDAILELEAEFNNFIDNCDHSRPVEKQDGTDLYVEKFRIDTPLPSIFARRTSEVLNNIKNSFDMALFSACCAIGRRPLKNDDLYFPWKTNPADLEGSLTKKKKPIPAEFWKTIRSHEPYFAGQGYTGGSNLIRAMAKLVNQKHTFGLKTLVRISNPSFTGTISEQGTSSILRLPNWDSNCNEMILWTGASPKRLWAELQIRSRFGTRCTG